MPVQADPWIAPVLKELHSVSGRQISLRDVVTTIDGEAVRTVDDRVNG